MGNLKSKPRVVARGSGDINDLAARELLENYIPMQEIVSFLRATDLLRFGLSCKLIHGRLFASAMWYDRVALGSLENCYLVADPKDLTSIEEGSVLNPKRLRPLLPELEDQFSGVQVAQIFLRALEAKVVCDQLVPDLSSRSEPAPTSAFSNGVGFRTGQLLDCLDSVKKWYAGTILDVEQDASTGTAVRLRVHYNGWGSKWDEWIQFPNARLSPYQSKYCASSDKWSDSRSDLFVCATNVVPSRSDAHLTGSSDPSSSLIPLLTLLSKIVLGQNKNVFQFRVESGVLERVNLFESSILNVEAVKKEICDARSVVVLTNDWKDEASGRAHRFRILLNTKLQLVICQHMHAIGDDASHWVNKHSNWQ